MTDSPRAAPTTRVATLEDLEARIAALEATQADYRCGAGGGPLFTGARICCWCGGSRTARAAALPTSRVGLLTTVRVRCWVGSGAACGPVCGADRFYVGLPKVSGGGGAADPERGAASSTTGSPVAARRRWRVIVRSSHRGTTCFRPNRARRGRAGAGVCLTSFSPQTANRAADALRAVHLRARPGGGGSRRGSTSR